MADSTSTAATAPDALSGEPASVSPSPAGADAAAGTIIASAAEAEAGPAADATEAPEGSAAKVAGSGAAGAATDKAPDSAAMRVTGELSAAAPAFVPKASPAIPDLGASLPPSHQAYLRKGFHTMKGDWVAYYLGSLKSFNSRTGYGFLECAESRAVFGVDIFIHRYWLPMPWHVGQLAEFSVNYSSRGQPQATDVNWLPRLPTPAPVASSAAASDRAAPAAGASAAGPAGSAAPAAGGGSTAAAAKPKQQPDPAKPRQFGELKNFLVAQGYGFIQCDEIFHTYQRDVYFDKTQLPGNTWRPGQTVEFTVAHNPRGHPQARDINWDPLPLLPSAGGPAAPDPRSTGALVSLSTGQKIHTQESYAKLQKLLRLLHEDNCEAALISAIDFHGRRLDAGGNCDIDFVTFVLDRIGDETEVIGKIKDFVSLLLLLMIAKLLRIQLNEQRCRQLIRWFMVAAETIDPSRDKEVLQHLPGLIPEFYGNLQAASKENSFVDAATLERLSGAVQKLESKISDAEAPPPSTAESQPAEELQEERSDPF